MLVSELLLGIKIAFRSVVTLLVEIILAANIIIIPVYRYAWPSDKNRRLKLSLCLFFHRMGLVRRAICSTATTTTRLSCIRTIVWSTSSIIRGVGLCFIASLRVVATIVWSTSRWISYVCC